MYVCMLLKALAFAFMYVYANMYACMAVCACVKLSACNATCNCANQWSASHNTRVAPTFTSQALTKWRHFQSLFMH